MSKRVNLVVVLPVGPSEKLDYVLDTIDSVICYTTPSRQIIIVDDSGSNLGLDLQRFVPELIVLQTPGNNGLNGGILLTLSLGYLHAYTHYEFQVMLRLDVDALVIKEGLEEDAIRFFERNPRLGVLGSYKVDCNGENRDFSGAARRLSKEVSWAGLLLHRSRCLTLRRLLSMALAHGYQPGEHCLGGATVVSYECIRRLAESEHLLRQEFRRSLSSEDQIFSLLVRSIGMELGDFATGNLPMGLRWRGLPRSPAALVAAGKKVIHSTRFWEDMKEDEIRSFFRKMRRSQNRGTFSA